MPLPDPLPLATSTVKTQGKDVSIHSLSRAEVLTMLALAGGPVDADAYVVAHATDSTVEEAAAWLEAVDNESAYDLIDAILVLSGVRPAKDEGSPKA